MSCTQLRAVNPHQACRLCWRQTKLIQEHLPGRRRGALNILQANRHGQQLFLANMGSSKNGHRPRPRQAAATVSPAGTHSRRRSHVQLDLFTRDWITKAIHRHGVPDPPNPALAARLDTAARQHAADHGWSNPKTHDVRTGIRIVLGVHQITTLPIQATQVAKTISAFELRTQPVMAVLQTAGVLHDDRPATIESWFEQKITGLPDAMGQELRTWFDVLHRGSSTPPRCRPRADVTIKTRLIWALPTLHVWAQAGHASLREINREDIIALLPTAGTPRVQLGDGLRSIFATLKARKLIFIDPMARIRVGNFERRTPLPADRARLHAALDSDDPPGAALAALLIFHGLRPLELRCLQLTDIRDGRVHLPDRTIPLAQPVTTRLAAYLDYRNRRWPVSINPHLFIHHLNAGGTHAASRNWVNDHLGMSAQAIRQDRIVDEVHATAGDLRRICDFFGVTMATAVHYASSLNHADFSALHGNGGHPGSGTEAAN